MKTGEGTYTYYDESEIFEKLTYEGGFKNDLFDAEKATYAWQNIIEDFTYIGGFKSGKFQGFGKRESGWREDGATSYEGQFFNGDYHGDGILTWDYYVGLAVFKGTFENGYIVYGTCETYQNSDKLLSVYNGSFSSGSEHGNGKIEYFGKFDEYMEDWSDNKVKSYEGDWASGSPNGQGTMVYKNGTKITGKFRDGEYVKPFTPPAVKIGTQTWMSQNLTITTFRNGDPIPEAKTKAEWETAGKNGKPAFCYYNNDPSTAKTHGVLYNYFAVNDPRGLAPDGWRVPSHIDVDGLNASQFPDLEKDIKTVKDKYAQGVDIKSDASKLSSKYTLNPININSIKTLMTTAQLFALRDEYGSFNTSSFYLFEFWTSSNYGRDANDNGAKLIVGDKTIGGKLVNEIRIVEITYSTWFTDFDIKTTFPLRCEKSNKGNGLPVRLIKID